MYKYFYLLTYLLTQRRGRSRLPTVALFAAATVDVLAVPVLRSTTSWRSRHLAAGDRDTRGSTVRSPVASCVTATSTAGSTRPGAPPAGSTAVDAGTPSRRPGLVGGADWTAGEAWRRPGHAGDIGTSTTTSAAAAARLTTGVVHRPTPTNIEIRWYVAAVDARLPAPKTRV